MDRNEHVASPKRSSRCRFTESTDDSWSNVPHVRWSAGSVDEGDDWSWMSTVPGVKLYVPLSTTSFVVRCQCTEEGNSENSVLPLLVVLY